MNIWIRTILLGLIGFGAGAGIENLALSILALSFSTLVCLYLDLVLKELKGK